MGKLKERRMVKVQIYDGSSESPEFTGRLLGLVDERQFENILKNMTLQSRVATTQTMPLSEIRDNFVDLEDMRLVISVRKIGDKDVSKRLLITNRLGYVSDVSIEKTEVTITNDDGFMYMKEEKV